MANLSILATYINADDIATLLRHEGFNFSKYDLDIRPKEFIMSSITSGLVNDDFGEAEFKNPSH